MNAQLLDSARAAYRAGDFSTAADVRRCQGPWRDLRRAHHLRGNSLMRLARRRRFRLRGCLADDAYGKRGALLTNQGNLAASGDLSGAAACFNAAVQDSSYPTPYSRSTSVLAMRF